MKLKVTKKEIDEQNQKLREQQEYDKAMKELAKIQERKRREQEQDNEREREMKTPKW